MPSKCAGRTPERVLLAGLHAARNALPTVVYRDLRGEVADTTLGRFDLIIGSDILYESGHAAQLAALVLRHALPDTEVLITDPGRSSCTTLTRALVAQGYAATERRRHFDTDIITLRGRLLRYRRPHVAVAGLAAEANAASSMRRAGRLSPLSCRGYASRRQAALVHQHVSFET